jgi:hypothetical protein
MVMLVTFAGTVKVCALPVYANVVVPVVRHRTFTLVNRSFPARPVSNGPCKREPPSEWCSLGLYVVCIHR